MIVTDNIDEYSTLNVFRKYCENHDECSNCKLKFICDCLVIEPHKLEISYQQEKV